MDPIDREVLALKHFEQLSTSEIAEVLGCPRRGRQPLPAGDQAAARDPVADPRVRGVLTRPGRRAQAVVRSPRRAARGGVHVRRRNRGPALVLELAEEFLERYRRGERPPLKEYIDRHPELADEIREVFPAMAMMEKIALADESLAGDADRRGRRGPGRRSSSSATSASSARSAAAAWASSTRPSRSRSAGTSR